ncbi:uncharacterized protein VTP21DRAFT_10165 [Calcarisporiella thermophila]|uniref:uncharacterized protein n=1 Tax=Calcarisporiella thermophila TaxID=911321 RepID=UPI003743DA60
MYFNKVNFVALFIVLFCSGVLASRVQDLTDSNFNSEVKREGEWLVEFYAPWCGACRRFAPLYEQAAERLSTHAPKVAIGKVNVEENPGLASRFFISRIPQMYHIKDHEVRKVNITFETSSVVDYVVKEKWKEDKVWNGLFSPYSIGGTVMNGLGIFSGVVSNVTRTVPAYILWPGMMVASFAFAWLIATLTTPNPPPARSARPAQSEQAREAKKSK